MWYDRDPRNQDEVGSPQKSTSSLTLDEGTFDERLILVVSQIRYNGMSYKTRCVRTTEDPYECPYLRGGYSPHEKSEFCIREDHNLYSHIRKLLVESDGWFLLQVFVPDFCIVSITSLTVGPLFRFIEGTPECLPNTDSPSTTKRNTPFRSL